MRDQPTETYQLNGEQKLAAEFDGGHALVLAGAGTGKTSTIVARVDHLVRSGVDPRRILLLTFTRRAARELAPRRVRRLEELHLCSCARLLS